ncbi:MAG: universal stress protein [Halorhabdus sp.]
MDVLVGVCGSENSFHALETAIKRAEQAGDEVTVAILDEPSTDLTKQAVRERVTAIVDESDVPTDIRVIDGQPGANIVEIAGRDAFDHVVLGGCDRTPMGKIQLSDVAQFVLFNADVSVTIVR